MKKTIRLLSVVLSALMILSVFPAATVFATDVNTLKTGDLSGKTGDCDWEFKESEKTLVISGSGATEDVNGDFPFDSFSKDVEKVEVKDGVTEIGERLFSNFWALKSAKLPDTVKRIGFCAFAYDMDLETVNIPKNVENIEGSAFYGCIKLKDVTIPESAKKIDTDAFVNTGLSAITIKGKNTVLDVHSVGYNYEDSRYRAVKPFTINCDSDSKAQEYKDNLIANTPPDTNVTWDYDEKTGTLTLSGTGETPWVNWDYPAPWEKYSDEIVHLVVNEGITVMNTFGSCKSLNDIKFPNSLEKISANAFCDSDGYIYKVEFGNGLKEIGESAFYNTQIDELKLPDSLKKIGRCAFMDNDNLSSIDFGKGIEEIGEGAFYNCSILSVYVPDNVKKIGEQAFGYYYDERWSDDEDAHEVYGDFVKDGFEIITSPDSAAAEYAKANNIALVTGAASINKTKATLKAGKTVKLNVKNSGVRYWYSSDVKVAVVDENGKVSALKKGKATIYPETPRGLDFKCKITVTSNPTIKIGKKKFNKKTTYSVKKGGKLTVKISGKASAVDNVYKTSNKKVAKVTSKPTAKKVKIKGYKKGKATVTVKVNGVKFKIKVKVK